MRGQYEPSRAIKKVGKNVGVRVPVGVLTRLEHRIAGPEDRETARMLVDRPAAGVSSARQENVIEQAPWGGR
jgi:hypothetical protein